MEHREEIDFVCRVMKKLRVRAVTVSEGEVSGAAALSGLDALFDEMPERLWLSGDAFDRIAERTLYRARDAFDLNYVFLLLPDEMVRRVLFIGPFLSSPPTRDRMLEIGERNGVTPRRQKYLEEYYRSITVLMNGNHAFTMLDALCESIWDSRAYAVAEIDGRERMPELNISKPEEESRDILVNIKAMESRYEFENGMMLAVTLGQSHKADRLLAAFDERSFEKRLNDPLRNAKNYGVIMNTLLRKAAEKGGVHPLYLDRVSSEFAARIEGMTEVGANATLMFEMFRTYCLLVRKHQVSRYSLVVQRSVVMIDSDLSAHLTLGVLAEAQSVSPGYLSAVFKRDTGMTVSEFVRTRRVEYASHLLATTELQVQTVAQHCGIIDVQYFTKIFKRHTGMTPLEYRRDQREKTR